MSFFLLAGMTVLVQTHMSLVVPGPARNAVDRKLPIFQQYPWYPYVRASTRVRTVLILCRLLLVKYMDHELTRKYTYDRLPVLLNRFRTVLTRIRTGTRSIPQDVFQPGQVNK